MHSGLVYLTYTHLSIWPEDSSYLQDLNEDLEDRGRPLRLRLQEHLEKVMSFTIGSLVRLNEDGRDCYSRNSECKSILPGETMEIVKSCGFDSGRRIWEVRSSADVDSYFEEHLELVGDDSVRGKA